MIQSLLGTFLKVTEMSEEDKKNRMVEIKLMQLMQNKAGLGDDLPPTIEMEAMAILQTLFPINNDETPEMMMSRMSEFRDHVHARATEQMNK